ncbi:PIG-P-domain-containing protein [Ceratobasidium sp. AG-I]|nr:PIG-P-domain-containing protein [Ceratobasidium sp. AG-I]
MATRAANSSNYRSGFGLRRASRATAAFSTSKDDNEPTSPASPVAIYPPLLIPEDEPPTGSAAEFYGFVAWLATAVLWFVYILWALLPDSIIQAAGISWYPSREWALLFPSYAVFLALLTYFTYFALAMYATPSYSDIKSITDRHAHPGIPIRSQTDVSGISQLAKEPIPQAYDLPIGFVNQVLYGKRRRPTPHI